MADHSCCITRQLFTESVAQLDAYTGGGGRGCSGGEMKRGGREAEAGGVCGARGGGEGRRLKLEGPTIPRYIGLA